MKHSPNTPITLCEPSIGNEEMASVQACLQSGFVSSCGPLIAEFEAMFAEYVGARYAVATASGTAAIHAALTSIGVMPGSSVVVSDLTFVASVNPAIHHGAKPILCDSELSSWCMDPDVLEQIIARNVSTNAAAISAIIPVHLFGRQCRMDQIMEIAERHSIPVIEDATESLGSSSNGRMCGTYGEVGCYSFNGNKLITSGAGGMVVTNSKKRADHIRHIVNQARSSRDSFIHSEAGYNFRMSNLAASLGIAQLKKIDDFISAKRHIAQRYNEALSDIAGLDLAIETKGERSCFWLYSLLTDSNATREHVLRVLNDHGIQARRFFEPLHKQPYIKDNLWTRNDTGVCYTGEGNSDDISSRGLNLPCSVNLEEKDQQRVIDLISSILNQTKSACTCRSPQEALVH